MVLLGGGRVVIVARVVVANVVVVGVSKMDVFIIVDSLIDHDNRKVNK